MRIKLYESNHGSFVYKLWCGLVYNLSKLLIHQITSLELTEWETGPKKMYETMFSVPKVGYNFGKDGQKVEEVNTSRLLD